MELRQLEYFVAVAEEAGFTRAAERVQISQSGVSAQIRQLEHEVGTALIDRSGRTATVTPAGAAALPHARAALAAVDAVRAAVDEVTGLERGRLVIGMVIGCTVAPLFEALAAFHRAHPGVELALLEDGSDLLVERVRTGSADLALVATAGGPPQGLDALPLVDEPLVAVVPDGHPLLRRRHVTLRELADHTLICLPPETGIRTAFERSCAARDVRPVVALQASAPPAVLDLARRGLGVGVLSASMVEGDGGSGVHGREIADASVGAVLALVWGRSANPALPRLLRHARAAFSRRGQESDCDQEV